MTSTCENVGREKQHAIECFTTRDIVLEGRGRVFHRARDAKRDVTSMLP